VVLRTGEEPFPGYYLRRLIGAGGFAQVWAAQTADGRPIALKFLPCNDRGTTAKEVRALQRVQSLRHPYLVQIERIWCHLGYIVVAMELADGSLEDMIEVCRTEFHTTVMPELVCQYLRQAAEAIDFLNTPQLLDGEMRPAIQHCDIKPSNLLLFGDTVKLADFGLASLKSAHASRQTPAGTLAYAAPEVHEGRVSDRTDQFALAVTYCELRGGRLPFRNAPAGFKRSYSHPPPDLSMLTSKEVPIIVRALSPLATDRWPSCKEMMDRLSRVMGYAARS
jgi:serine/threonine-protein kinase